MLVSVLQSLFEPLNLILMVAGVIIAGIGALVIWRGVTEMIPKTGLAHGGLFTLGGVVFLLLGLGLILVPLVKERRNAKKKQETAL